MKGVVSSVKSMLAVAAIFAAYQAYAGQWWVLTNSHICKTNQTPASFYKDLELDHFSPSITEELGIVYVYWIEGGESLHAEFYRSEAQCLAMAAASRSMEEAEKQKHEEYLDKYR